MKEIDEKSQEALARWRDEKARLAELERRRLEDELMERSLVEKTVHYCAMQFRETLEALPVRIAPLVAAESDQFSCQRILEDDIYNALINMCEIMRAAPVETENEIETHLDFALLALRDRKIEPMPYIKNHIHNKSVVYMENRKNGEK